VVTRASRVTVVLKGSHRCYKSSLYATCLCKWVTPPLIDDDVLYFLNCLYVGSGNGASQQLYQSLIDYLICLIVFMHTQVELNFGFPGRQKKPIGFFPVALLGWVVTNLLFHFIILS